MRKLRFRTIKWLVQGPIEQRSPTFLAPGTSFVEDNFSTDWGRGMVWGWFKDIAFLYFCYSISSTSDHQALILEVGNLATGWEGLPRLFSSLGYAASPGGRTWGSAEKGAFAGVVLKTRLPGRCPVFLTSSVALSPPSGSLWGHLWALFQPHFASTYPSLGTLLISISFIIWLPKRKETFPLSLSPNSRLRWSNTHLLHQLPTASLAAVCFSVGALIMSEAECRRAELPKLWGHEAFLSVVCPLGCGDIHLSACHSHRYTPAHSRLQEITCLATEFSLYVFLKYV